MKSVAKMRFIDIICGLGVFLSPVSIDNGVVRMRIKGNCLQFTRNHHHLSLASLAWILRTLHSYQVSCHLFSDLLPSSHKRKTPRLELNTFPRSVLPPVDQPDSTSISGEQQTLTVTARSYCPLNSFQTGSIPQVYLHEIETPGNTDTHTHTHTPEVMRVGFQKTQTMIH